MRRLTRRDDRGAVAVFTAIFLAAILLPAGLITIDVGRVYAERRQLQNGADAAALAVAQSCAGADDCDTSYAEPYADNNANDGSEAVTEICGTGPGLTACDSSTGAKLSDCVPLPAGSPFAETPYVQVRTRTEGPDGLVLIPIFGGDPTSIGACARASWGGVRTTSAQIAFTVADCVWSQLTNDGAGPYPTAVVELNVDRDSCGTGTPGNFGWLDEAKTSCTDVIIDADGSAPGEPGVGSQKACSAVLDDVMANGGTIFIPIFDSFSEQGNNGYYTFLGWAAFVPTAYDLQSNKNPTGTKCSDKSKGCIFGYFTQALVPNPIEVGGPNYGATAVALTG